MNEVGRRVFVGTVAAGLPLLVNGGVKAAGAQRQAGAAAISDPVFLHLVADMKRSVQALSRKRSGEQVRRLSSSLRLLATWGASTQFDARVQETMRGVVSREGRGALLRRNLDPAMFQAEARALGFDGGSVAPLPALPVLDNATRQRVVDDIIANGVTATWRRLADTLDDVAARLDQRTTTDRRPLILIAQTTPEQCAAISQQLNYLSVQMVFWCAPWFWWVPEPCGLASAAYLGSFMAAWWLGCV